MNNSVHDSTAPDTRKTFAPLSTGRHLERGQELDSTYPGTFMDMGQLLMQEGFPAKALSM